MILGQVIRTTIVMVIPLVIVKTRAIVIEMVIVIVIGQRFYFYAAPRFFLCWLACGFFLYAGAVFFLCWGGPFLMLGAPPCATSRFFLCCRVFFFMLHGASSYSARFWGP